MRIQQKFFSQNHNGIALLIRKIQSISSAIASISYKVCIYLTCVLIVSLIIYSSKLYKENRSLKVCVEQFKVSNSTKDQLLYNSLNQIGILKDNESQKNNQIDIFAQQYAQLTKSFITSRSGDRVDRSSSIPDNYQLDTTQKIQNLKILLDNFKRNNLLTENNKSILSETEEKLNDYLKHIPMFRPIEGRITSRFGIRKDPFKKRKTFHAGLDIAADYGRPIKAAGSGIVVMACENGGYGNMVMIDHGNGFSSIYGHASKLLVEKGQTVKQGDIIAEIGSTGRSTGPHLHFEIRLYDQTVDPVKYLSIPENVDKQ